MKVIITGGHLTPALAYIDFLKTHHPDYEVVFVGREYSQVSTQQKAQEKKEVQKRGIKFIALDSGKVQLSNPLQSIVGVFKVVGAVGRSLKILYAEQPDAVLSFGSYLAVPVGIAAWLQRIPLITHEQTRSLGFANKLLMYLAKHIALSYKETKKQALKAKSEVTGNLLRQGILKKHDRPEWIGHSFRFPLLYITGGSQGSEIINSTVGQALKCLVKDWVVVHQCGPASAARNYKTELEQARIKLPGKLRHRYMIKEWVSEEDLSWIYRNADMAVSRSGANTVLELTAFNIPTVYIPLPFSHAGEQQQNAEALKKRNMAEILPQQQLTPDTLCKVLLQTYKKHATLKKNLQKSSIPFSAAEKLHALVARYEKNQK